jgi:hypothetical protein
MASRDEYDELEKIVREQKPGFTIDRRAEPEPTRGDTDIPSEGTPDIEDLKAKADEILDGKKRTQRGSASRKARSNDSGAADADDIRIVYLRPDHPIDSADQPTRPKHVIISLTDKQIIGEQG